MKGYHILPCIRLGSMGIKISIFKKKLKIDHKPKIPMKKCPMVDFQIFFKNRKFLQNRFSRDKTWRSTIFYLAFDWEAWGTIFRFFKNVWKSTITPINMVFWSKNSIYGSIWPIRMVPTPTILIWNMTLGVVKLTRKFEPYNPIIQFFTIEKCQKMPLFKLKDDF